MRYSWRSFAALAACVLCVAGGSAHAQDYPNKAVRIVLPFSAGGSSDPVARLIARHLTTAFGQPFVVENRPGAGGNIGSDIVAKSAPDGYTLLFTAGSFAINPSLYSKLPFDPAKDFDPVVHVATLSGILVVHPSVPASNVKELIQLARSKPGGVNYASAGSGTVPHLAGELFRAAAKIEMTHVPYKGSNPALSDLIGGQVQVMFANMPGTLQHVKAGRLKVLAVTGARRSELLPDVPTIGESGLPGYEATNWYGVFAPAGTPPAIVARLNAEINKAMAAPEFLDHMRLEGAEAIGGSPAQFRSFFRGEMERWAPVVKSAGVKVD
ncbi:MAG TPA: tripartite tricarboxylate transporter substrate binding protein [Usitatibacter sp.]|nr:tripartite tricarboxylate transporter substrate binding protein [Usitatibacter sp.]